MEYREHFGCGGTPKIKVLFLGAVAGVGLCKRRKMAKSKSFWELALIWVLMVVPG